MNHKNEINCSKCKHYFITFDKTAPKGCRIFDFKSQLWPSILVKQSSGIECESFELKNIQNSASKQENFNDDKYWK